MLNLGALSRTVYLTVRSGIIARLFSSKSTYELHTLPPEPNPFLHKCIRNGPQIVAFEETKGLKVDTDHHFGEKNYHLFMKVKLPGPWPKSIDPTGGERIHGFLPISFFYSEAFVSPITATGAEEIDFGGSAIYNAETPSIGDPFSFGSTGIGKATVRADLIYDGVDSSLAPTLKFQFDLVSMGTSYDTIFQPVHQEQSFDYVTFFRGFSGDAGAQWVTNKTVGSFTLISAMGITVGQRFIVV